MEIKFYRLIGIPFAALGGAFLLAAAGGGIASAGTGENAWIFPFVFGLVGGIFFAVGLVFLLLSRAKAKRREELLANGRILHAKITGVEQNRAFELNGRFPYRVRCRYTDEAGTVHEFLSDNLRFDPTGLFLSDTVEVYVDPYTMDRYYVDVAGVLPNVAQH